MAWTLAVFGNVVKTSGKPLVFWAHGFHTGRTWLERLAQRRKPDLAIANSLFTKEGVTNIFPKLPCEVVTCPVELEDYPERDVWRSAQRKEDQLADDEVVIIQVSRIEGWKGHLLHLEALALIRDVKNWVCWMVGGAQKPEEAVFFEQLKEKAISLGIAERVKFLGQRTDVPRLLRAADIFCQPNQAPEPFGIVFVEALWAGLPVVTTAWGGAVEIIDDSCGLLLPPGNIILLAEALRRLIESPGLRSALGTAGKARATQLCDPGTQINRLRDLTRQIVR